MERIKDLNEINRILEKFKIQQYFDTPNLIFSVRKYNKGEFLKHPLDNNDVFQFVVEGNVNIYFIRENGTIYFIKQDKDFFTLGDMEFLESTITPVYVEALEDVTSITISLTQYRDQLLNDNKFLKLIIKSLSQIVHEITNNNANDSPLPERILNHMKYDCMNGILQGLEKTAFRLNCSNRQLQRILNQFQEKGIVKKIGKGKYQLL